MHTVGWILAIDQGTHASRALLLDGRGAVRFETHRPIALTRLDVHRVEQDALQVLDSVRRVMEAALTYANERGVAVTVAGLATQRSTVVAWDGETGMPLYPALSWQDTRAERQLARFASGVRSVEETTGLRISPHYGVSKLAWLVQEVPAVAAAAGADRLLLGPLAAFLLYHLLDGAPHCCDVVNAGRTLLCNLEQGNWDNELLRASDLHRDWLPCVRPVLHHYGVLCGTSIPLRAVNGDQNAALCAQGEPERDRLVVNAGSGAFIARPIAKRLDPASPLLISALWSDSVNTRYLLEGTVNGAGSALRWARDHLGTVDPETVLAQWPECPGGPPLFLNAVGGLGSPWWKAGVATRWLEPVESSSAECCVVGVAESILFLIHANLIELQRRTSPAREIALSGGISRSDGWCQELADLSRLTVVRLDESEATARGIGWLAAGRPSAWRQGKVERFAPCPNAALRERYTRFMAAMKRVTGGEIGD